MPHVPCGQNYTVTVIASNKICDSDPSVADTLQSGNNKDLFISYTNAEKKFFDYFDCIFYILFFKDYFSIIVYYTN